MLLGRFAPIFFFNCEHVLNENIEKQRKNLGFSRFEKILQEKKLLYTNFFNFDHS